jgi:hypothetical protein
MSWRSPLARFAVLLGAVAWVSGWSASLVHHSLTVHVTCEVHGDLVDVGHAGPSVGVAERDHDVARALDVADDHDHDCALQALGVARIPAVAWPSALSTRLERPDDPVPAERAPRGPPLAYAPKTSPPGV